MKIGPNYYIPTNKWCIFNAGQAYCDFLTLKKNRAFCVLFDKKLEDKGTWPIKIRECANATTDERWK